MAARSNNIEWFTYTGQEDIPLHATHVFVTVRVIRARAFEDNPNIVEVICHEDVEQINNEAFAFCQSLRRVFMPGVTIVEYMAFRECQALTDVECGKLQIVGNGAFCDCESLGSINLPSARIVEWDAFYGCTALTDANLSSKLERIKGRALSCCSLERITIPLKDRLIIHDDTFTGCEKLKRVDLVGGELHKTIAALQLEEWKNDMYEEIDAINQTLPTADAGEAWNEDVGEKAAAIRDWIRSVLSKISEYKAEHRRLLEEDVAPTLQCALPQDIVRNSVLPFLELPSNSFE